MVFYRIGAYSLIITCCLHVVGHFKSMPPANETEKQLVLLMEMYEIHKGSGSFTMMDLQDG